MNGWRTTTAMGLVLGMTGSMGMAQDVTVQQPVFGVNSVSTTVLVPDRGGVGLGGVSRGASSRSQYGPFPAGRATGRAYEASSMSAHVWIHDLREMDRMILNAAEPPAASAYSTPRTRDAYQQILTRSAGPAPFDHPVAAADANEDRARATRHYRLGLDAEKRGSATVARLHFQAAARLGSTEAASKLDAPAITAARTAP